MSDITQQLADALRAALPYAENESSAIHELADDGDEHAQEECESAIRVIEAAREALAAYDAQPKRWTVFIRDAGNTGTTYITCVESEDVEAAKAAASALCREDWGYDETDQLHILGVIAGDIGAVVEWDDCE